MVFKIRLICLLSNINLKLGFLYAILSDFKKWYISESNYCESKGSSSEDKIIFPKG